jgi:hypothetical protein
LLESLKTRLQAARGQTRCTSFKRMYRSQKYK